MSETQVINACTKLSSPEGMLHGGLHLSGFALPSAEPEEGHLHPVVQAEGGGHAGAQLQTDVLTARDCRVNVHKGSYARINIYRTYRTYRLNLFRICPDRGC